MAKIIVSIGTSLLTNRARPWEGWKNGDPLPGEEEVVTWLKEADPVLASAETNTLTQLGLESGDRLYYLHSDTPEGEFCARCLNRYYTAQGFSGMPRRIKGMSYSAKGFSEDGLRSLVHEAFQIHEVRLNGFREPMKICATGGFKAEMAYLNLVGLLTGSPVYYIHERMQELVELPAIPVSWDFSLVENNKAFFEWIYAENRPYREVETRLKGVQPEVRTLVVFQDGVGKLSAAGEALYLAHLSSEDAPRVEWPPADPKQPREKVKLDESHTTIPSGTREFVDWLSRVDFVSLIQYLRPNKDPGFRATVLSPDEGVLKVKYGREFAIELKVTTTARGQAQCEKVAEYIESNARNFR